MKLTIAMLTVLRQLFNEVSFTEFNSMIVLTTTEFFTVLDRVNEVIDKNQTDSHIIGLETLWVL